jgi:KH domain
MVRLRLLITDAMASILLLRDRRHLKALHRRFGVQIRVSFLLPPCVSAPSFMLPPRGAGPALPGESTRQAGQKSEGTHTATAEAGGLTRDHAGSKEPPGAAGAGGGAENKGPPTPGADEAPPLGAGEARPPGARPPGAPPPGAPPPGAGEAPLPGDRRVRRIAQFEGVPFAVVLAVCGFAQLCAETAPNLRALYRGRALDCSDDEEEEGGENNPYPAFQGLGDPADPFLWADRDPLPHLHWANLDPGLGRRPHAAVLLLPSRFAGKLNGVKCAMLHLIRSSSGCSVQVSQRQLAESHERTVTLSGPGPALEVALTSVVALITQDPVMPYVYSLAFAYRPPGFGGFTRGKFRSLIGAGDPVEETRATSAAAAAAAAPSQTRRQEQPPIQPAAAPLAHPATPAPGPPGGPVTASPPVGLPAAPPVGLPAAPPVGLPAAPLPLTLPARAHSASAPLTILVMAPQPPAIASLVPPGRSPAPAITSSVPPVRSPASHPVQPRGAPVGALPATAPVTPAAKSVVTPGSVVLAGGVHLARSAPAVAGLPLFSARPGGGSLVTTVQPLPGPHPPGAFSAGVAPGPGSASGRLYSTSGGAFNLDPGMAGSLPPRLFLAPTGLPSSFVLSPGAPPLPGGVVYLRPVQNYPSQGQHYPGHGQTYPLTI